MRHKTMTITIKQQQQQQNDKNYGGVKSTKQPTNQTNKPNINKKIHNGSNNNTKYNAIPLVSFFILEQPNTCTNILCCDLE